MFAEFFMQCNRRTIAHAIVLHLFAAGGSFENLVPCNTFIAFIFLNSFYAQLSMCGT
jgi:hypothetical protein